MSDEPVIPKPPAAGGKTSKVVLILLVLNLAASGFGTGPVTSFEPFVVNLDEPGTARYLKVTLQLELANPEAAESAEKSKQLVRDAILSHLSGLHVKDTLGAEAKEKIRTDVLAKVEKVLGPAKARRVFFQEFVVQ
jgi:flagellar FliL protein